MKVDFGVQVKGRIVDSAFTMNFEHTWDRLLDAVKDATYTGVKARDTGREILPAAAEPCTLVYRKRALTCGCARLATRSKRSWSRTRLKWAARRIPVRLPSSPFPHRTA